MPNSPRFVVVTGLSGSGKSQALRFLEDLGFYCIDNLPPTLIPTLADLVNTPNHPRKRIAVCADARSGDDLLKLPAYLDEVAERGIRPDTLYLDSDNDVLLQRYSESRRRHPNAPDGNVKRGIERERELLEPIRARADLLIDTSSISLAELRERLANAFHGGRESRELLVTVMSFGFKYGIPPEADLVLDVRFLPNPYYDEELRIRTGADPDVRDYVLNHADSMEFIDRIQNLLKFLLPRYVAEPKSYLTIAVGCTGGRHRSVAVAHQLALFLRSTRFDVRLRHRDMHRPA